MAAKVPSTVSVAFLLEEQLTEACKVGDVKTVRHLVPKKVKVNAHHGLGHHMPPLHVACFNKQLRVVEALLELEAEVNGKDNMGRTPLYIACMVRHLDLVRVLMAHGADVNVVNNRGRTALHMAFRTRDHDILEALLSTDGSPDSASLVDVNVIDDSGRTPLHYVCQNGWVDDAKLLFSRGAEVRDKEEQEKLLRSAHENGHRKMVTYLLKRYPDLKMTVQVCLCKNCLP